MTTDDDDDGDGDAHGGKTFNSAWQDSSGSIVRSPVQSVSGTQKKLKIFESNCPRQLLKLACTSLRLQFLIVWDALHGKDGKGPMMRRCSLGVYLCYMSLGFSLMFSPAILEHVQT